MEIILIVVGCVCASVSAVSSIRCSLSLFKDVVCSSLLRVRGVGRALFVRTLIVGLIPYNSQRAGWVGSSKVLHYVHRMVS